jgi:FkbM family methyltransferase
MNERDHSLLPWEDRKLLVNDFVHSKEVNKFVFGCNQLGQRISELVNIAGFVDDRFAESEFAGHPVLKSNQIPSGSIVVSAIVGISPVSVERMLHELGVDHVDYFAFLRESGLALMQIPFWGDAHNEMIENWDEYVSLLNRMSDDASVEAFHDFMLFRKTMNLEYMTKYTDRQREQYFESFLELNRNGLNFFDLGCFDGFTSAEFSRHSPNYSTINAFEPVPRLFESCELNLRSIRDCVVHNFGAASESRKEYFLDDGSSSSISSSGNIEVQLRRLDDVPLPPPSLVKIDIEGAELDALLGMSRTIETSRPMFAVAAYHYPSETRDLVRFWDSLGLTGQLNFRHYTEGTTESVLFLCPQ